MNLKILRSSTLFSLLLSVLLISACGEDPTPNSLPTSTLSNDPHGSSVQEPFCGDGIRVGDEVCDTGNLNSQTCESLGFAGGALSCNADCSDFDTSRCFGTSSSTCGDNIIDSNETCDGTALGLYSCEDFGFIGGILGCNPTCDNFDTSRCEAPAPPSCGNGTQEGDEVCDGFDVGTITCVDFGFSSGYVECNSSCTGYNTANCVAGNSGSTCGNNIQEGSEVCDGTSLDGQTCQSLGFSNGTLTCNSNCSGFNTSQCSSTPQATCGNNQVEGTEICDGNDLNEARCTDFGFTSGQLVCNANCSGFNTSYCITETTQCNSNCPDSWIGDNNCDPSCNTAECNYDGGDCNPSAWTCNATYYASNDGCDCGCGVLDPDCLSSYSSSCDYSHCPSNYTVSYYDNAQCEIPAGWICSAVHYAAEDGCDCGCGITDPDCDSTLASSCTYEACPEGQEPDTYDNAVCVESAPTTCAPGCLNEWIGDGICDESCDNPNCSYDLGDCQPTATWTCDLSYYAANDGCDCGCGVIDLDCSSYSSTECTFNWCSSGEEPVSYDNTQCETVPETDCAPGCYDEWIGDGWCDSACYTAACGYDNGDCN